MYNDRNNNDSYNNLYYLVHGCCTLLFLHLPFLLLLPLGSSCALPEPSTSSSVDVRLVAAGVDVGAVGVAVAVAGAVAGAVDIAVAVVVEAVAGAVDVVVVAVALTDVVALPIAVAAAAFPFLDQHRHFGDNHRQVDGSR
eukprot:TRINITY_DN13260_c3_g1_i1.p2 TRINITY_DN13260_c3_g1~~TRINITY_DN13260_c3_g1_i1.p2  ORF type:complete len:140 (+),score=29.32 TRINITY_DN13260_c3_g1_i1:109-528(+)